MVSFPYLALRNFPNNMKLKLSHSIPELQYVFS